MTEWKIPKSMTDQSKEIARVKAENETLRARVAELESAAWPLYSWTVENLTYEQFKAAYEHGHRLGQVLEGNGS